MSSHVAYRPEAVDIADRSVEWGWDTGPGVQCRVRCDLFPIGRLRLAGP